MQKLYKKIVLFIIPFIVVLMLILFLPYDKKFAYHKITGGCSIEYAYHRIVEDTTKLDIVFIGSSKTHCGVNDLLIRILYEHEYKKEITTANISFCGTGRNLQHSIVKELFKHKKPKAIVIEIRENEDPNGHISYGVIADAKDILLAPILNNKNYTKDIFNGIKSRYDYLLWGNSTDLSYHGPKYGFGPNYRNADSVYLTYFYTNKLKKLQHKKLINNINRLSKHYLEKIVQLAHENDCQVYFLYLPSFGFTGELIQYLDFYKANGTILYPPTYFMSDHNYWSDQNHLKRNGADSLTAWLAEEMLIDLGEIKQN
ncbi:MAG: hypothetical protein HOG71_15935 [Bacteroidetes bacterium]|jgi:hypothetical protein|nr:hypothetical protein [Bacteroidota bacterium]